MGSHGWETSGVGDEREHVYWAWYGFSTRVFVGGKKSIRKVSNWTKLAKTRGGIARLQSFSLVNLACHAGNLEQACQVFVYLEDCEPVIPSDGQNRRGRSRLHCVTLNTRWWCSTALSMLLTVFPQLLGSLVGRMLPYLKEKKHVREETFDLDNVVLV